MYDTETTAQRIKIVNDHGKYMHKPFKYQGEEFQPLMISFMDGKPYVTMAFTAIPKDKLTLPLDEFMTEVRRNDPSTNTRTDSSG